ncbi:MAG: hypothetical protein ACP5U1_07600, partial [Desulfomonilaceae bacterium]
ALTQNDDKLQYPIINNIAEEVWKTKEAKLPTDAKLGEASLRGVNLECVTALSALQAGSDLLILRSPKTLEHIRKYLSAMTQKTDLASMGVDLTLSAEPPKQAAKPAAPKPAAPPKAEPTPPPKTVEKPKPTPTTTTAPTAAAEPPTSQPVVTQVPKAAPVVSDEKPSEPAAVEMPGELTDEDIQALREMVAAFRAIRAFISDIGSRLLG